MPSPEISPDRIASLGNRVDIIAELTDQAVIARSTVERVVAGATDQRIVAGAATQDVSGTVPGDPVGE